uniref:Uncharacterized protein n=1 Tax=Anguilla anguilla TaxID=7936 RepID=A0A0E9VZA9_ANGAN
MCPEPQWPCAVLLLILPLQVEWKWAPVCFLFLLSNHHSATRGTLQPPILVTFCAVQNCGEF